MHVCANGYVHVIYSLVMFIIMKYKIKLTITSRLVRCIIWHFNKSGYYNDR